jgi:hypothetical protein
MRQFLFVEGSRMNPKDLGLPWVVLEVLEVREATAGFHTCLGGWRGWTLVGKFSRDQAGGLGGSVERECELIFEWWQKG